MPPIRSSSVPEARGLPGSPESDGGAGADAGGAVEGIMIWIGCMESPRGFIVHPIHGAGPVLARSAHWMPPMLPERVPRSM